MTAASIYSPAGKNTVLRFRYDAEDLSAYRVRAYAARTFPSPQTAACVGEADGVASGNMSIPVQVSGYSEGWIFSLTVRKVDANDVETTLTLDRTYELKIAEDLDA